MAAGPSEPAVQRNCQNLRWIYQSSISLWDALAMMKVVGCTIDGHNLWLVGLAGLVCVLASHSAFSLFGRTTQEGPQRQFWLLASAVCMGFGLSLIHI